MAKNTTTYKKMSKCEQRKHNAQFREVWDVCPLTRVVTNKKAYSRSVAKRAVAVD